MHDFDVIVIGGGIAGVSIACELSADRTVCLLEMESTLAFHTTGRSAATFLETYGGPEIRCLTTGSRAFLEHPPAYVEAELLTPRPLVMFAKAGRGQVIEQLYQEVLPLVPDAQLLSEEEVRKVHPYVRPGYVDNALLEVGAMEIDVMALHGGYVRGLRENGAEVHKAAKVVEMKRAGGRWEVTTADGTVRTAQVVVDAAGAWGDVVAGLAGAKASGLMPLLRTIFMVNSPDPQATAALPIFGDVEGSYYFKPEGLQFLCSPADETPDVPRDATADPMEISRALDEINEATTINARSVTSSWGGLRTFVPDRNFVVGLDPEVEGFMWFVGQGGYGIQTAPASAKLGAALVRGEPVPTDLINRGLDIARLAPQRPGMHEHADH